MFQAYVRRIHVALAVLLLAFSVSLHAESRAALERDAKRALQQLVKHSPVAKELNTNAVAVLVFPSIKKVGFVVGGQYGEGVLLKEGATVAYYSTGGASYGLQAGLQKYGYALFFVNEEALAALDSTSGFELGVGPSFVAVEKGWAKSRTTITMQKDIYAFIFSQKGLMAGVGIQGNKITKLAN